METKVTHEQALAAYKTLMTLSGKAAKAAVSLSLFRLKKKLRDAVDFVSEEEQKLVEKYGGQITAEGRILIDDDAKRKEFTERLADVYKIEFEFSEKVKISAGELPDLSMTDLETLDSFIDFD